MSVRRDLLLITVDGFGKRVPTRQIRLTGRDRKGVRVIAHGATVAAALMVRDSDTIVIATRAAKIQTVAAHEVPRMGRTARGARVVRLLDGDTVASAAVTVPVNGQRPANVARETRSAAADGLERPGAGPGGWAR